MAEENYTYYEFVDLFNFTDNHLADDMFQYYLASSVETYNAILGYILSAGTLVLNIIIAILCTYAQRHKSDVFYLQIINFSITNILIGAFVIPLTVYSILFPWNIGVTLCKIWIICDVLLPFTSMLILILLTVDRLVLTTYPKVHTCLFQKCLKQIIIMTPWLMSFVIVVPFWTHGALPYELNPGECVIMTSHSVALACTLLTFFIPLFCIILLLIKIVTVRMRKEDTYVSTVEDSIPLNLSTTTSSSEAPITERKVSDPIHIETVSLETILSVFLADIVYCSMWFPYHTVSLIMTLCTTHLCIPSSALIQSVTWTATASAALVPYVWLADSNIRYCRSKPPSHGIELVETDV